MRNYQWKMGLLKENFRLKEKWLTSGIGFDLYRQSCKIINSPGFGSFYRFAAMVNQEQKIFYFFRSSGQPVKRFDQVRENCAKKLGCLEWPEQELSKMKF